MSMYEFIARLERPEGVGTWTFFNVPFNVEDSFGKKGQVKVKGTINKFPYRSSVMPHGDGTHYMVINQTIRQAIGVSSGDKVTVTMKIDDEPRTVTVPEDFQRVLDEDHTAKAKFEDLHIRTKRNGLNGLTLPKERKQESNGFKKPSSNYSRIS